MLTSGKNRPLASTYSIVNRQESMHKEGPIISLGSSLACSDRHYPRTYIPEGTLCTVVLGHKTAPLHSAPRADLLWWRTFLQDWNGTSFFPVAHPTKDVISDASGSYYGCGTFSSTHGWFQLKWPGSWESVSIAAKDLVPIVIAASLWGYHWKQTCVHF